MSWNNLEKKLKESPVIIQSPKYRVHWIGPLMDKGYQLELEDMGTAAWGYLEYSGWQELLPEGSALDSEGRVRSRWMHDLSSAAARLAERGGESGPTGSPQLWMAWLFLSIGTAADLRRHWEEHGSSPLRLEGA
jgi:hypothetical protein